MCVCVTDPVSLAWDRSGVGAAGTGVGKDTAVSAGEVIPGIYCGFGDDLIKVPENLSGSGSTRTLPLSH